VVAIHCNIGDEFARIAHNRPMPSFVYVLGCRAKNRTLTYVGWTTDVARRLAQHNSGKGARSTRGRTWVLLHTEKFRTRRQAMSREWHLKQDRKFRKSLAQGG
jgi:putative endonuclease